MQQELSPIVGWPRCPEEGCTSYACLVLQSGRCYPHTVQQVMRKSARGQTSVEAVLKSLIEELNEQRTA